MKKNELKHHGVKGQKWGVRRYQNKDGTLTDIGRKRYEKDAHSKGYDMYDKKTGEYYKKNKKGEISSYKADIDKYVTNDLKSARNLVNETSKATNTLKTMNEESIRRAPKKKKMDLSNMSDKEMRDQINRKLLERQYDDLFNPKETSKGRQYLSRILETSGSVLTLTGSALSIALAIRELRG